MKKLALVLTLVLLFLRPSLAATISTEDLRKHGIHPEFFHIDRFSHDRSTLFGIEKATDPVQIHKKGSYVLWLLRLDGKQKLKKVESIPLPIQRWHQITYSDDSRQALLSSDLGANFYVVDIPGKKVRKIAGHTKGEPGFRQADPILYYVDGFFYAYGYYYDKDDVTGDDMFLARVHPDKSGVDIFEKTLSMKDVRHALGISTFGAYLPPDRVIWGCRRQRDALLELKLYDSGKMQLLDSGIGFTGVVTAGNRIFYCAKKPGKKASWDLVVRDLDTNNVWHLGDGKVPFTYPFISEDGSTVAATAVDFKNKKMTVYCAMRKRDFKLQTIQTLQNVPFGTFRISPDGAWYAFYSPDGIKLGAVK